MIGDDADHRRILGIENGGVGAVVGTNAGIGTADTVDGDGEVFGAFIDTVVNGADIQRHTGAAGGNGDTGNAGEVAAVLGHAGVGEVDYHILVGDLVDADGEGGGFTLGDAALIGDDADHRRILGVENGGVGAVVAAYLQLFKAIIDVSNTTNDDA